jgi:type IV secretory pathway VirB2 component (pilin)
MPFLVMITVDAPSGRSSSDSDLGSETVPAVIWAPEGASGPRPLVAIVIGGLMFMFGEGGAKRQISGIVFGGGLALFAAQFVTWLFS